MKKHLLKTASALVLLLSGARLGTAQCTAPAYQSNTTYAVGQEVPNKGKLYRCNIGPWCSSPSALYYEPGTGMAWTSAWTEIGVCGSTPTPVLTTIAVTPSSGSIATGQTLQFTAAPKDQSGNAIASTITWSVSGGGSINANGLFSATTAGTYTVSAKNGSVTGTASITVNNIIQTPVLTSIAVTPGSGSVVSGQTLQFTAAPKDQSGNAIAATVTWTVSGGGSINANGFFSATTAGTYTVSAKSGSVTGTASVTVTNQTTSNNCTEPQYVAGTTYATGASVQSNGKKYQCTVGGWCSSSAAWAYAPGTGSAWTSAWTEIGVCGSTQTPVLTSIALTPANGTVTSGQTLQFSAAPKDQFGNAIAATITWSVSGGGSINANGLFSATAAGTYTVTARNGSVSATASVTVNNVTQTPVLTSITVTPASGSVATGQTRQFTAAPKDQFGNAIAATITWSVSGGGSINANGLFTATTAGTYTVTARSGSVSGTASVTVTQNPVLTTITVTPTNSSVVRGSTLQFAAAPRDQSGNPIGAAITWSVSGGGSINVNGLFTSTTAGNFTVTASSGSVSGTASFTVTNPATGGNITDIFTEAQFNSMFMNVNDANCNGRNIFTYANFVEAVNRMKNYTSPVNYGLFANEGTVEVRKRELVAFLANAAQETTGGWPGAYNGGQYAWGLCFREERGYENGQIGYTTVFDPQYQPVPGKSYHGRGPIQLSYPTNYGQFSVFLYGDKNVLLNNPERVALDGVIAFQSAIWFWMTPQSPKPSAHDVMIGKWVPSASDVAKGRSNGFGMTINIINGGLECGSGTENAKVVNRIGHYTRFAGIMNVSYDLDGTNRQDRLGCARMTNYASGARIENEGIAPEILDTFKAALFPNPATDAVTLRLHLVEEGDVTINVYDGLGLNVINQTATYAAGVSEESLDVNMLRTGIYIVTIVSSQGKETIKLQIK